MSNFDFLFVHHYTLGMNEKLPLLRQAIQQLEDKKTDEAKKAAKELSALVEKLTTEHNELAEKYNEETLKQAQQTEQDITKLLKQYENENMVTSIQNELNTFRIQTTSAIAANTTNTANQAPQNTPTTQATEKKSWRWKIWKVFARWAAISVAIYAFYQRVKTGKHVSTLEEVPSNNNPTNNPPIGTNISDEPPPPSTEEPPPVDPAPESNPENSTIAADQAHFESLWLEGRRLACMHELKKLWYTDIAAAAIAGNMQKESWFDTNIPWDGWDSLGICQRNDRKENVGRKTNLKKYAQEQWEPINYWKLQLRFLDYELTTLHDFKWLKEKLNAWSLDEATWLFLDKFENPANKKKEIILRKKFAKQAYEQLTKPQA